MEDCAERPFVASGSLGRLCREAFCCTRVTWEAANIAVDATKLLTVKTSPFERNRFVFSD